MQRQISYDGSLTSGQGKKFQLDLVKKEIEYVLQQQWPMFYHRFAGNLENELLFTKHKGKGAGDTMAQVESTSGKFLNLPLMEKKELKAVKPKGKSRITIGLSKAYHNDNIPTRGKLLATMVHEIALHGLAYADEIYEVQTTVGLSTTQPTKVNLGQYSKDIQLFYSQGGIWHPDTQHGAMAANKHGEFKAMSWLMAHVLETSDATEASAFREEIHKDIKAHKKYLNRYVPNLTLVTHHKRGQADVKKTIQDWKTMLTMKGIRARSKQMMTLYNIIVSAQRKKSRTT